MLGLRDRRGWVPGLAAGALALGLGVSGALAPVRLDAGDALLRLARLAPPVRPAAAPDVVVVAIDPRSLRALPAWPWPRSLYGQVVERLDAAGARAVGFDVDFSSAQDPAEDAAFAAALRRSGRGVLAAFRQVQRVAGAELEVANLPIAELAGAARGLGNVSVPLDPDGLVRRAPASEEIGGRPIASFAVALLAAAAARSPVDGAVPRVDYRRAEPPVTTLSFVDVIEGRFDPRAVAGRVALVGATAAEFQDLWSTPLGPARPGVWIQAMLVRTLAAAGQGAPVLRAGAPAALGAVTLALLLLVTAASGWSHARRLLLLGGLAGGVWLAAAVLLARTGWLLDPILPSVALGGHYVFGLEALRRRFGRRLAERELSLTTLFRVGRAAIGTPGARSDALGPALALLGDVVDADGVALLRVDPDGRLDGRCLEWSREPGRRVGDASTAEAVLDGRAGDDRLRVFEGARPGGGSGSAVYAPLRVGETPVGVLVVEREAHPALDDTALRMVATVGSQLALSVDNLRLLDDLRSTFASSVAAIATAIEARDGYTEQHCQRLALFSSAMARRLGLPGSEVEAIRLGALLHDVGKIGIRDEVLLKPGAFTPEERRDMERHTDIGHGIVSTVHGITGTTLDCVRHHHEQWNGGGYPLGLAGEAIPLGARLVAIVDVWDALSTRRPYKRALPQAEVRARLEKSRGEHFDPELLDLFLRLLDEEGEEMLALLEQTTDPGTA